MFLAKSPLVRTSPCVDVADLCGAKFDFDRDFQFLAETPVVFSLEWRNIITSLNK